MNMNIFGQALSKITGKAEKTEEEVGNEEMLKRYWSMAESSRKEMDWKWFMYDLWVTGNHYAKYDKNTQQIRTLPKTDGRPKVAINKTFATLRAVRSFVLQNNPKPEVTPHNMTEDNLDQANTANDYLDYFHNRQHLKTKLRASMWHALKYSVGFWQILPSDDENNPDGIDVMSVDPYDLYWDPVARTPSEARYVVLAVRRNIADLKEDPKYKDADWDKVQTDQKMAASNLKSRIMQFERGDTTIGNTDKDKNSGTVIVKEFWYKSKGEEEYEDDDEKTEQPETEPGAKAQKQAKKTREVTKYMICTMVGEVVIRKPEDTGLNRFPFFRLASDIEPLSMYGTGWVKNLIQPNKLINSGESSRTEYNLLVNKARIIADKGAGVNVITNEHGIFVEKKRGFEVTPMQPIPIDSGMLENQIISGNRYMEDLGSWHDASMGRQSSSDQSGRSIEALQEGDSNNLSELIENTEEFLEDVYEYILYLASKKYQFARNLVTTTQTGEKKFISIIGEDAANRLQQSTGQQLPPGTQVIASKNVVDVRIASYLAYTADGRRQAMKDLVSFPQMAQLPPEFILEAYSIGPIAAIVKQMKEQQKQQQAEQAQQQQQQMQQQAQMQQQQQQSQMQMEDQRQQQQVQQKQAGAPEAIALIKLLINGQMPKLPKNIGPDFIGYLDHFMQSPEGQQAGGTLLSELQQIRDQAMLHMKGNIANVENGGGKK